MNIFIRNKETGEQKQFKDGILLKSFVQRIFLEEQPDDTRLYIPKSSDEAIDYLNKNCINWTIAYQAKEKFNLNYQ